MNDNIRLINRAIKKNKRLLVDIEDKISDLKNISKECEIDLDLLKSAGQKAHSEAVYNAKEVVFQFWPYAGDKEYMNDLFKSNYLV